MFNYGSPSPSPSPAPPSPPYGAAGHHSSHPLQPPPHQQHATSPYGGSASAGGPSTPGGGIPGNGSFGELLASHMAVRPRLSRRLTGVVCIFIWVGRAMLGVSNAGSLYRPSAGATL